MYSVGKPLRIIDNIVSDKPKLFILISIIVVSVLVIPVIIPHATHSQHIYHIILHIASLIFSLFLFIVSTTSYIRNGGSRLLFMSLGFLSLVIVETLFLFYATQGIREILIPMINIELPHVILFAMLARISNGGLTYHLGMLEKFGEIRVERMSNKRVTRYFTVNIPKEDFDIISCFRSKVIRSIVFFVIDNDLCTFNEIVDHVHPMVLREAGILRMIHGNDRLLYSITDKVIVNRILLEYRETFTDRVIDNYADMFEKL